VRIKKGSKYITDFRTPLGNNEYLVLPFGLTNALSGFRRMIDSLLLPILGREVSVYLDDILMKTHTIARQTEVLREVFQLLIKKNLFGQETKCVFYKTKTFFSEHKIWHKVIAIPTAVLYKIEHWGLTTSLKPLQSTLGFFNFVRKFIPNYKDLIHPLQKLIKSAKGRTIT
jgi:Reverse transcriptase (RNA-dependent DNA polymerase)